MTADKHDFFQQWADFLTGASHSFAFDEQTVSETKRGAEQLFETADDAYQIMLSHCDRLLSQHADAQGVPALDTFMGFDLKLKDVADAYADLLGAMANLNALNFEAATAPFRCVELGGFSPAAMQRPFEAKWQSLVDESLIEMQRSHAYLTAKSDYVSYLAKFQKSYRSLVESFQEYNHAPTLSEFEDLTKQMHELRRELWALKKKLP